MPRIPVFTSKSFFDSIEIALRKPPDAGASIARIKRILNSLPDKKLYSSDHGSSVTFYVVENRKQKYISKRSQHIYALARRKYLLLLLEILELTHSDKTKDVLKRAALIAKLQNLVDVFYRGNLDLARIVLTSKQYKWYTGNFKQKYINKKTSLKSSSGVPIRTKSERDILNKCESLAVPVHYEEEQIIFVQPLVEILQAELWDSGAIQGQIYTFRNSGIHWNVPHELEIMNSRGSIWKSYDPLDGVIVIYNDFRILCADGTILIWEHEGLIENFIYRYNSSERASIMKFTKTIQPENLIETYEHDIDTPEKLIDIIERRVLPRLWF